MNNIGTIIYGRCDGFFDDYTSRQRIILFETENSICCRRLDDDSEWDVKGWLETANFENSEEKQNYINSWKG